MRACKVLVGVGCRSDEGLSAPIIKRLKEDQLFNPVHIINLIPGDFYKSYKELHKAYHHDDFDLVFCTADRVEMIALACFAFHNRIPIAHFYGGVINDPITTFDDIDRHCISLWADLVFCEDLRTALNISRLWAVKCPNLTKTNAFHEYGVHIVGISHLDDAEIDESLVPNEEYDLVLINPTTLIDEIPSFESSRETIIIEPNPDIPLNPSFSVPRGWTYGTLPHSQFLGLLKNCTRFITNSSSAYYEAPHFLKPEQIVMVGARNKNRSKDFKPLSLGASDKIVEILKKWWEKKQK